MPRTAGSKRPSKDKLATPPFVADTDSVARVRVAAEAIGMTVEELANLMVDGGFTALPPKDDITERYTLEDLGRRLWSSMQELAKPRRVEWFDKLNDTQKRAIIIVLHDRGYHFAVIAQEFNLEVGQVITTWNRHCDEIGSQVVGLRLDTIAGQIMMLSSRAQQMAMESRDHASLWRIGKEYVETLQGLGIVDRAKQRIEVTHRFDDAKRAEVDALVDLERKKDVRRAEIKVVENVEVVHDEPPATMIDYDEDDFPKSQETK